MAQVFFGTQFARLTEIPPQGISTTAKTLRSALDDVFGVRPMLRGYVLDDQGHLRQHVAVFVDGQLVANREVLGETLTESSQVYVLPALSGGSSNGKEIISVYPQRVN